MKTINTSVNDNDIMIRAKEELVKYFKLGIGSENLIFLFPTHLFSQLADYIKSENIHCAYIENSNGVAYFWGIEVKVINNLDNIYVSLK